MGTMGIHPGMGAAGLWEWECRNGTAGIGNGEWEQQESTGEGEQWEWGMVTGNVGMVTGNVGMGASGTGDTRNIPHSQFSHNSRHNPGLGCFSRWEQPPFPDFPQFPLSPAESSAGTRLPLGTFPIPGFPAIPNIPSTNWDWGLCPVWKSHSLSQYFPRNSHFSRRTCQQWSATPPIPFCSSFSLGFPV